MYESIQRLFDVPGFLLQQFSSNHIVFDKISPLQNRTVSAIQYAEKSNAFSHYLLQNGLQKGNRVITILQNAAECNFIETGILQAGGVHVPLSALYTEEQVKNILSLIRPVFVFTSSSGMLRRITFIAGELGLRTKAVNIRTEDVLNNTVNNSALDDIKNSISSEDTACILFTSGSTAHPKGVVLSHKNILASVKDFAASGIFSSCSRSISFLPLSLSGERKVNYACQLNGITVYYPQSSKNIFDNLESSQAQLTALVPYLLNELNTQTIQAGRQPASLKKIICGGAAAAESLLHSATATGVDVFEVYGLTETASLLAYNTPRFHKKGTAGKTAPSIALSFSQGNEILVKSDCVMKGYLQTDESLDTARDEQGWFHTGDSGYMDEEGFLHITGRIKSAFKNSRGAYVYPEQIESALLRHPLFSHVMVTGENADSLTAVILLKDETPENEDTNARVKDALRNYNSGKSDDLKITRYLLWSPSLPAMFNAVSMKAERNKMAEKLKSDSLIHFIAVD